MFIVLVCYTQNKSVDTVLLWVLLEYLTVYVGIIKEHIVKD